jgi:hypothetical protein
LIHRLANAVSPLGTYFSTTHVSYELHHGIVRQQGFELAAFATIGAQASPADMTTPPPTLAIVPAINPAIRQWILDTESLDYSLRQRVLRRMRPPMELFLYKYLPWGGYSERNLHSAIVGSMLRLNAPSTFNDPFELAAYLVTTATEVQKRERFENLVGTQSINKTAAQQSAAVDKLMATPDSEIMPVWQKSLERTRNAMGVCCFAGSGNNTLMWSHYASDHQGICLQFDRALDLPTFSHAIHVEYEPALPAINFIVELKKDIGAILARKHPCWRYEAESRIIIDGQAGRYLQFRPEALSGLIYGCRAEYGLHETIERLLRQRREAGLPPINLYRARQHSRRYKIVVNRA